MGRTKFWWRGFRGEEAARGRKKPPRLIGRKPPWAEKMEGELMGRKRQCGGKKGELIFQKPPGTGEKSGGGDFVERKRHGQKKSLLRCSAKCRGVLAEKTDRGGKMRAKMFGETPPFFVHIYHNKLCPFLISAVPFCNQELCMLFIRHRAVFFPTNPPFFVRSRVIFLQKALLYLSPAFCCFPRTNSAPFFPPQCRSSYNN
ncbi:hypothetical protein T11_13046 [Trichinella zimbabwensis]|uniref:Uncharacterized protein n=1 Tax=Trichinella zimbabwensis TaxID=268475 RepID=A0A0V1GPY3_9BILA|nr:hypothetical protein T11_13046 [Trichinella zimbabwensis]